LTDQAEVPINLSQLVMSAFLLQIYDNRSQQMSPFPHFKPFTSHKIFFPEMTGLLWQRKHSLVLTEEGDQNGK